MWCDSCSEQNKRQTQRQHKKETMCQITDKSIFMKSRWLSSHVLGLFSKSGSIKFPLIRSLMAFTFIARSNYSETKEKELALTAQNCVISCAVRNCVRCSVDWSLLKQRKNVFYSRSVILNLFSDQVPLYQYLYLRVLLMAKACWHCGVLVSWYHSAKSTDFIDFGTFTARVFHVEYLIASEFLINILMFGKFHVFYCFSFTRSQCHRKILKFFS